MMYKKLICLIAAFIIMQSSGIAQEFIDLMEPREVSQDFLEYNRLVEAIFENHRELKKGTQDYVTCNTKNFKKLSSLNFFAAMNNPYLFHLTDLNNIQLVINKELISALGNRFIENRLLFNRKNYAKFNFKYYKYYIRDLYFAPYVLIGKITNVRKIDLSNTDDFDIVPYFHKYEMQIIESVNYNMDFSDKKIKFVLSPLYQRMNLFEENSWIFNSDFDENYFNTIPFNLTKKYHLEKDKVYLVFINPEKAKSLEGKNDANLPQLYINHFGVECFPVTGSEILNLYNYFGSCETITITKAKEKIDSILNEIKKWKE